MKSALIIFGFIILAGCAPKETEHLYRGYTFELDNESTRIAVTDDIQLFFRVESTKQISHLSAAGPEGSDQVITLTTMPFDLIILFGNNKQLRDENSPKPIVKRIRNIQLIPDNGIPVPIMIGDNATYELWDDRIDSYQLKNLNLDPQPFSLEFKLVVSSENKETIKPFSLRFKLIEIEGSRIEKETPWWIYLSFFTIGPIIFHSIIKKYSLAIAISTVSCLLVQLAYEERFYGDAPGSEYMDLVILILLLAHSFASALIGLPFLAYRVVNDDPSNAND